MAQLLLLGRVGLAFDLLPHLDRRNGKFGRFGFPGWVPLVLAGPEILRRGLGFVNPRLAGVAIFEPAVGASNSQVDDEVKLLIKRRVQVGIVDPRVGEGGTIRIGKRELSTSPEVLVEWIVENL